MSLDCAQHEWRLIDELPEWKLTGVTSGVHWPGDVWRSGNTVCRWYCVRCRAFETTVEPGDPPSASLADLYKMLTVAAILAHHEGRLWFEAEVDGHRLYVADARASGVGPVVTCDSHGWECGDGTWRAFTPETTRDDLDAALALARRAQWVDHTREL